MFPLCCRQAGAFARFPEHPEDLLSPDAAEIAHAWRPAVTEFRRLKEKKVSPRTVVQRVSALRFLYVKTLKRHYMLEHIPFPKAVRRLPIVLSQEEVGRLIDSASNLFHRAMLMTLYSTGVRRAELCHLKVSDIDSQRMVVHVRQGKGGRDRDVPLSPKLLETLREYWRWMKPKHLGAEIGFLSVLDTWGQNLQHHPHIHCVIPSGGLSPDHQRWIHPRHAFFLPVRVLAAP